MHPPAEPEIPVRVGDVIAGKYRVDRVLGVGGMGVVVAARHLQLDELVAIKLLLPDALADSDAVRRFEREARAAVKIKSEHVTRILDVGALDNGAPFIVMEHLEGEDLAERIERKGPCSIEQAIALVLQACEAIAEAHALGIVHRDLKPANMFCVKGADGHTSIKVLDFGISKITRTGGPNSGFGMTKTRAVMGSPYYMSPEQMESPRSVDARTDIWSLGIVLYQLLTADVPFRGETLPQVCVNVATRPAPMLRKIRPDVPAQLEAIVLRCLEKDASKRFPTIAALASALARFGSRRAQASLDRIYLTSRQEESGADESAEPPHVRATDRPVTGPLPSWGATAKSLRPRARSIIGWTTAALLVVAFLLTFVRRQDRKTAVRPPAVLITPPVETAPKTVATAAPPPPTDPIAIAPTPKLTIDEAPKPAPPPTTYEKVAPPAAAVPFLRAAPLPAPAPAETEANPYLPAPPIPRPTAGTTSGCTLNLNAMPAAAVLLDGKPLGYTPKTGLAISAGEHRVVFKWQESQKLESFSCSRGEARTIGVRQHDPEDTDEPFIKNPYR